MLRGTAKSARLLADQRNQLKGLASQAARRGTPLDRLMDVGGWSSPAMPTRFIEAANIGNEGICLEYIAGPRSEG